MNCGFEVLRVHIPSAAKQKKMSKVDTLRHAVEYIQNLQMMLTEKQNTTESYVQQQPQYPLTPQTPAPPMTFPTVQGNESGYDTSASSFYSSATSPGLLSPPATTTSVLPQFHHSPNSSSIYNQNEYNSHQTNLHQYPHPHQDYYNHHEPNSEEDELLDVIAKWQDN